MPVTARLSKRFYDTFGDEIANDLVEWFNQVDATYRQELREHNDLNWGRVEARIRQERHRHLPAALRGGFALNILLGLLGCTAALPPSAAAPSWLCASTIETPDPARVVPMQGRYALYVADRKPRTATLAVPSGYLVFEPRDSIHGYARDVTGRRLTAGALPDYPFAGTGTVPASVFGLDHFSIPLSSTDPFYPGVLVERSSRTGRTTVYLGAANLLDGSGAYLDLERASGAGDTLAGTWTSSPGGGRGVFCAIRAGP